MGTKGRKKSLAAILKVNDFLNTGETVKRREVNVRERFGINERFNVGSAYREHA